MHQHTRAYFWIPSATPILLCNLTYLLVNILPFSPLPILLHSTIVPPAIFLPDANLW